MDTFYVVLHRSTVLQAEDGALLPQFMDAHPRRAGEAHLGAQQQRQAAAAQAAGRRLMAPTARLRRLRLGMLASFHREGSLHSTRFARACPRL